MSNNKNMIKSSKGDFKNMSTKEKKKAGFNKLEYDNKFHKENYKRYSITFRNGSDDLIISKMDSVPNKIDYIRQLILNDISKTK